MRRITYIEAIESIQGQLGSRQDLRYNNSNNKAWYSPVGGQQRARNYNLRFIGMRRTIDGRNYYAVKKNSTFKNSTMIRLICAQMGATASLVNSIEHDLNVLTRVTNAYIHYLEGGGQNSRRKWLTDIVRPQILAHTWSITLVDGSESIILGGNPFSRVAGSTLSVPYQTLAKFAPVLDNYFKTFQIAGINGDLLTMGNLDWEHWVDYLRFNPYNIDVISESGTAYVKIGSLYICDDDGVPVRRDDVILATQYILKDSPN